MSMPTAPTATTIVTEALKRFLNGGTPEAAEITRATDYGLEKVKRDIMGIGKKWRPLLKTVYDITKVGVSHYANPVDYETDNSVGLMTGSHTGALSAVGGASSVTLAADEDATQGEVEGKWLLITSGTGVDQARQVDDYNVSTKVCTMAEAYTTEPIATDGYIVVNNITDLTKLKVDRYDQYKYPGVPGTPQRYAFIPNDTVGQIALHPVPNAIFGLRRRYYIDLLKLDTAIAIYSTILRRWCNVFEQGVFVWKLREDDDRYSEENKIYQQMLMNLLATDLDGFDASKIVKPQEE